MTTPLPQGGLPVERLCALAGVSRAGYYRRWREAAPRREKTAVRDAIQRLALAHRHYGYRRIAAQLRREGMAVNRKRVLRLMREDNLLCLRQRPFVPVTTVSRHDWRVVPNLARGLQPTGLDQLWVADITYVRLAETFAYLAVVIEAFSRRVLGWALERHLDVSLALARPRHGAGGTPPGARQSNPPLRSRRAIRLRGLHRQTGGAPHPAEHEPRRQPLRQRQSGELYENP